MTIRAAQLRRPYCYNAELIASLDKGTQPFVVCDG